MHKNSTSTKDFRHGETVTMVQNKTKSIYRKKIFLVSGTRQQWAGNLYNKILRKHERTNPTTSTSRHHKLCCDSKRRRPAVSSSWSSRWCRSTHTHTRKRKKKNRVQLHAVDGEEAHASTCVCCSFQVCSIPQEGSRHMAPRWR